MIEAQVRDGFPRDAHERRAGRSDIKRPKGVPAIERDDAGSRESVSVQAMRGGQRGFLASGLRQVG